MSEKKQVQSVREARTYNQAAETVHAGLGRISSRIRLSLSLRIAGHYCGRLVRTFLLAAVVMTLALAAGNVPGIVSLTHRVAGGSPGPGGRAVQPADPAGRPGGRRDGGGNAS